MDTIKAISTRRSIRKYLPTPVDDETMMTIVEAGSMAPTAGNLQDWKFVLITNKAIMKELSTACLGQECVHNAAFVIVVCSDPEQTERNYGLRGVRLYTVQNCAAAAQNMLLAAHDLGLGGNWIGAFDEEKVGRVLGMPSHARPQIVLTFGYPDEVPAQKRIKELSIITHFDGFGNTVKDVHRLLKDYAVDWEARVNKAHTIMDKAKVTIKESVKKTSSDVKESPKVKETMSKIKEKLSFLKGKKK